MALWTAYAVSLLPTPSPWEAPPNTAESLPLPGFTQGAWPFTFPEPAIHTWLPGFSGARMM